MLPCANCHLLSSFHIQVRHCMMHMSWVIVCKDEILHWISWPIRKNIIRWMFVIRVVVYFSLFSAVMREDSLISAVLMWRHCQQLTVYKIWPRNKIKQLNNTLWLYLGLCLGLFLSSPSQCLSWKHHREDKAEGRQLTQLRKMFRLHIAFSLWQEIKANM